MEKMPKRRKDPLRRKLVQLDIPGLELVEAVDEDYADGYEWYALVTDLDMDARDVLPLYRERGDGENIFDEMKNQWGWGGFTAHSLAQTALFAGLAVIAANLWNIFARLGEDGAHREAVTSRPLLQSCVARLSRHARQEASPANHRRPDDAAIDIDTPLRPSNRSPPRWKISAG